MVRMFKRANRKWSVALLAGTVAILVISALLPAFAVLTGSPSKFESGDDPTVGVGNMIVNTNGNKDWISVTGEANYVHLADAAATTSDDSFTPGQKQDTTCPTIEGHKNPPKDDFTDVASFFEVAANGDVYLYGATLRYAANGNASENIELKQGLNGPCPGTGNPLLARSAGDKLIAIDYLGGGSRPEFHVLTWVTSGACFVANDPNPCWGATVQTLGANAAEGGVSTSNFTAAQNPISGVALTAGKFAEFGINLSAAGIIPSGSCAGFSQTIWESRSSGSSFVSSTKDITIEDKDIDTCASVGVTKTGSDGGPQTGAVFTLYAGDDVNDPVVGTCTVDATGACLPVFSGLNPGQYTLDETTVPSNYGKASGLPVTFTLAQGEDKVLSFEDPLLTGAIVISKTAKHADTSGDTSPNLVAGFTITDSASATHTVSTDASGNACVDGLPPGSATVSETGPPTGYSAGPDQNVTVAASTTCANADGVVASFENIPRTDIKVEVNSQVDGGTASTIDCVDSADNSVASGSTDAVGDGSVTATDLEPDTYTCTIVVDP